MQYIKNLKKKSSTVFERPSIGTRTVTSTLQTNVATGQLVGCALILTLITLQIWLGQNSTKIGCPF